MKKCHAKTIDANRNFINGLKANPAGWATMPIKVEDLTAMEKQLIEKSDTIDAAEATVSEARHAGNVTNKDAIKLDDQKINLAIRIYANNPSKLSEYGIKLKKDPETIPPPTKTFAIDITDDSDGKGFVLKIVSRYELADSYEWQKGQSTTSTDLNTIPPMIYFKTKSKTQFIDDDAVKGIRYFYRVRAMNRNGQGPLSKAASRVQ